MYRNISRTCFNCSKKTKVVLVDLNLCKRKGGKIKFKRCNKKNNEDFCLTLVVDKICINIEKLKC